MSVQPVLPEPPRPPVLKVERRCADCGYGAYVAPGRSTSCPMCRGLVWVPPRGLNLERS